MDLNYKEKSLILAGLDELFRTKDWRLHIHLVDLQETIRRQDLEDLMVKLAEGAHNDLDELKDPSIPWRHLDQSPTEARNKLIKEVLNG